MCIMETPVDAQDSNVLHGILKASDGLRAVAENPLHEVQILYTQIDRNSNGAAQFRSFEWNVDAGRYFYPASTVKLPATILALEKLEALSIPMLHRSSPMHTLGLEKESTSSIARYIREIFLVSSNSANNRLFEFVGPEELSDGLQRRGFEGTRIFHRLSVAREPGAIVTNAMEFSSNDGAIVHRQAEHSFENRWSLDKPELKGIAYLQSGTRIDSPKDFAELNGFPLEAQQRVLRTLVFPDSLPAAEQFRLSDDSRNFLLREMSRWTNESADPAYDPEKYTGPATKELFFGAESKRPTDPDVRNFSKSGMAYGTVTDNAYIVDFDNGIEFFLSATLLVNANGTFNDDVYEYDTIGVPFMRDLGRAVHAHELKRSRLLAPNLEPLRFDYSPEL
ncbi:MAG: hypothetical protein ACI9R3_000538 [Verrucomicrobiales bacterium]|jgi:hypothetical protein